MGKTSLVTRYVRNAFNDKHVTTIQASFLSKRLNIDGKRVNLSIWVCARVARNINTHHTRFAAQDTAGQERFHALGPIYYRESQGILYSSMRVDSY